MSNERYTQHDITYEGQAYRLAIYVDHSMEAPEKEYPDCHGVVERMYERFDPKDPETHPALATEEDAIRHSMFRPMGTPSFGRNTLWYDFLGTVIKATEEGWGPGTPAEAAEADYAHLRGWYTDEWWWCVISLIPLDEREEDPTLAQYIGGVESTESIESLIANYVPAMHADVVTNRARRDALAAKNAALLAAIPEDLLT